MEEIPLQRVEDFRVYDEGSLAHVDDRRIVVRQVQILEGPCIVSRTGGPLMLCMSYRAPEGHVLEVDHSVVGVAKIKSVKKVANLEVRYDVAPLTGDDTGDGVKVPLRTFTELAKRLEADLERVKKMNVLLEPKPKPGPNLALLESLIRSDDYFSKASLRTIADDASSRLTLDCVENHAHASMGCVMGDPRDKMLAQIIRHYNRLFEDLQGVLKKHAS